MGEHVEEHVGVLGNVWEHVKVCLRMWGVFWAMLGSRFKCVGACLSMWERVRECV